MTTTLDQPQQSQSAARAPMRLYLLEAALVLLAFTALYLLLAAGSHNEGYDGIGYLSLIRAGRGAAMLDPSHILFNWLGWLSYNAATSAGFGGGPLRPVQTMNALAGGVGIGLFWLLLRNASIDRIFAAGGCGMLAFSYGYWAMSEDVELYALSTTLLILTVFFAHRASMEPTLQSFFAFGVANGLAILSHNAATLLLVVAGVVLVLTMKAGAPLRRVAVNAAVYAGGAVVTVAPAYAAAIFVLRLRSPRAFYDWLTSLAQESHADAYAGNWQLATPLRAAVGAGRALVGGHFALSLPAIRDFVRDHFHDKNLRTELFLSRDFDRVVAGLLLLIAVCVAGAIGLALLSWLGRVRMEQPARALALISLAWVVPYSLFFAWWEPLTLKYWVAPWAGVTVLVVLPLASQGSARLRRSAVGVLVAIVVGLFVVNLVGTVLPQTSASNDYWRVRTVWYARNTNSSDLVFTSSYLHAEYLRYFTRAHVVDVRLDVAYVTGEDTVTEEVQRIIDAWPGRRVLFSSEALFPGDDEFSHCVEPNCTIGDALRRAYLDRSRLIADEPLEKVWQLQR